MALLPTKIVSFSHIAMVYSCIPLLSSIGPIVVGNRNDRFKTNEVRCTNRNQISVHHARTCRRQICHPQTNIVIFCDIVRIATFWSSVAVQ